MLNQIQKFAEDHKKGFAITGAVLSAAFTAAHAARTIKIFKAIKDGEFDNPVAEALETVQETAAEVTENLEVVVDEAIDALTETIEKIGEEA